MSLIAIGSRRSIVLNIAAATDKAGLVWLTAQTNPISFQERVAVERPHIALITNENLADATLFTNIRAASPHTTISICLTSEIRPNRSLWAILDNLEFDVLCTVHELTDCLLMLKVGRFYQSSLLQTQSNYETKETFPGWHNLTPAEKRVLKLTAEDKTGPQIANMLYISEKTVNNHKAKISQKLNITGGPGSLTRFALTHREHISD